MRMLTSIHISKYRFASPVSYWNPEYYGQHFTVIEIVVVLLAGTWSYKRLASSWGKAILLLGLASLLATHKFWSYIFTYF